VNALRVGAFQLLFTGIPAYAAVSSSVACLAARGERSFANGVLRAMARSAGHVEMPSLDEDPVRYASERFSFPRWIALLFVRRFGVSDALALCSLANRPAPLTLRVNSLCTSRDRYLQLLGEAGVAASPGVASGSVRLCGGADVTRLPGFREGMFVVQDEGAAAVSRALAPRPGDEVWDVCAAPGGKTTHLAELMRDTGRVLATDVDGSRVRMVRGAVARLRLRSVTAQTLDATKLGPGRRFNRILLDPPCSGMGVLRRNPDLRWNRRRADVRRMASRQEALLETAAACLFPAATLVYSTCTLTKEENEGVWTSFLRGHPEMEPDDPARPDAGQEGGSGDVALYAGPPFAGPGYRYILPHISGTDGFFVARAVKRG
jgi:16S rRNA (cytosine967-C5)-methyltransferase